MKQLTKLLLCITLMLGIVACSEEESPSAAVETYLKKAQQHAGSPILDVEEEMANLNSEALNQRLGELIGQFTYSITDEKINGKKAEVTVEIKAYPFGDAFYGAALNALSAVSSSNDSDKSTADYVIEYWLSNLDDAIAQQQRISNTVVIELEKTDEQWQVIDGNKALVDALLGNLYSMN